MARFECALEDHRAEDEWFEIEALTSEEAARLFVRYLDDRDSEYFPTPDAAHEVYVRRNGATERFRLWFEFVKSWRVRESVNV